jgi:hypothetical protein
MYSRISIFKRASLSISLKDRFFKFSLFGDRTDLNMFLWKTSKLSSALAQGDFQEFSWQDLNQQASFTR